MQVEIKAKGHAFAAVLSDVQEDGPLANGGKAYTARVEFQRDDAIVGAGRWNGEALEDGPMLLSSCDDTQDIYSALDREVRAALRDRHIYSSAATRR